MSIPIHFQQQISRMTNEQLDKALATHKYMIWIIEAEQIRRAHNGQENSDTPSVKNEDASVELEIRQSDDTLHTKPAI